MARRSKASVPAITLSLLTQRQNSAMSKRYESDTIRQKTLVFWLAFAALLWLAHTIGYLIHEYSHTLTACVLGYKANPLALDYGHLSVQNVLLLSDVDENVDYAPIFAAGKGYWASLIAVAGVLFGNGIFYFVSRGLYAFAKKRNRRMLALFAFLYCLMNVGNFLCYVPARTFTTHADMATLERGLHISPWWVATVLGLPFAVAIWHFFARLLPDACRFLFPDKTVPQVVLVAVSSLTVFGYFGNAGMHGYGATSHWISVCSSCVLLPSVLILCWPHRTASKARQCCRA